jgi:molybdopterin-guanine dinucleotide biosynthesis protein A
VNPPPVGVILTGGASRRMGADKALIEVGGRAMVLRVVDALRAAGCDPVECQGGDTDGLDALGLVAVPDAEPGEGPVVAVVQAIERHAGPVVVAACDLPDLDAASVGLLVDAVASGAQVAVARATGRRHLVGCWSEGSVAAARAALAAGCSSVGALLDAVGAVDVDVDAARVHNVNRPDDLPRHR